MTEEQKTEDIYLEDLMVAVQKSFSRVMGRTSRVPSTAPRSHFVDTVNVNISLRARPEGTDRLAVDPQGGISLSLDGKIDLDVRYEEDEGASGDKHGR